MNSLLDEESEIGDLVNYKLRLLDLISWCAKLRLS
jgi:hypothetical protein